MPEPSDFSYTVNKDGQVRISHHRRVVTSLKGSAAAKLEAKLAGASPAEQQHLLARATGNYKRWNERR